MKMPVISNRHIDAPLDFAGQTIIIRPKRPFKNGTAEYAESDEYAEKTESDVSAEYEEYEMPVYEFECTCGHVAEEIVPMGTKQVKCPKCQKKAKKILSRCGFELKGGGWYADGYASKKK